MFFCIGKYAYMRLREVLQHIYGQANACIRSDATARDNYVREATLRKES